MSDSSFKEAMLERSEAAALGFQSVHEHPDERALHVEGTIPAWLEGDLYRTGPGQYEVGEKGYDIKHWFDGKALNHKFSISGSRAMVSYRSRFACSDEVAREAKQGYASTPKFSQPHDPCERLYTKFKTAFRSVAGLHSPVSQSDTNVNVTLRVAPDQQTLLACTDNVNMQTLDPTTLEPVKAFSYDTWDKRLSGHMAAAHSATIDGITYNYILKFGPKPFYKIFSVDDKGKCKILKIIFGAPAAYLHSLAATENHVVLSVWQADIGWMGLGVAWKNNVLDNIGSWSPKRRTIHYVINRFTGKLVRTIKSDAFFCFHHINAYETRDGKQIVLDLATFPDTRILQSLRLDAVRAFDMVNQPSPEYRRIVLQLTRTNSSLLGSAVSRPPCKTWGLELPTVNPLYLWRKAQYAYGVHHTGQQDSRHQFVDSIIKLDLDDEMLNVSHSSEKQTDSAHRIWKEKGMVPGEPVFVPRPGGTLEDDGVVLTICLNVLTHESQLVVLDGRSLAVLAKAGLDCIFPYGFHGLFRGDKAS